MRILFVTASYLPVVNGVSYHLATLKAELQRVGHKVFILAPSFPGYKESDKSIIRYPSLPNPFAKKYPVGIPLVSLTKIRKIKPDVIHTHHPLIFGQAASQIAEKLSVPLFFTAHTQYEQYLNYYLPYGIKTTSKVLNRDLIKLSRNCRRVICPSGNNQERLSALGITNTTVVYNGVEKTFFVKPVNKSLITPTLVFTGRLEKEKNPLFLIKVARETKKQLPNLRFIVIGNGSLLGRFQRDILKNKLENNILLGGEVSRSLLPDIYRSAHLFITPSTSEVMPLSLIEAEGCGLPVISLKKSGLGEIVIDGKTGFLMDAHPGKIAEKIAALFANEKLLRKLSQNAYKHSLNFSIETTAEKLLEEYRPTSSGR